MRNQILYGVCGYCKQPHVLHSQDDQCPKKNFPAHVWRPLARTWFDLVTPAKTTFTKALENEKKTLSRFRNNLCFDIDYRNAVLLTAKALGSYQEAIRMADWQITPLGQMIWGESDDEQPLSIFGVICEEGGFTNLCGEAMPFHRAANNLKLDEQALAAIAEWCELFATAGVA